MKSVLTESTVEQGTIEWLVELDCTSLYASDYDNSERQTYANIVLINRLRSALATINDKIPSDAIENAIKKVTRTDTPSRFENDGWFHKFLSGEILAKEAEKLVEAVA